MTQRPEREQRRFWSKTHSEDRSHLTDCIVWEGRKTDNGYGVFETQRPDQKSVQAHRYSFSLVHGNEFLHSVVYGRTHEIDHLCRQRDCVNPEHLEWVTVALNRQRAHDANRTEWCKPGRHLRAKSEKVDKLGRAFCGSCASEADKRRQQKVKGVRHGNV